MSERDCDGEEGADSTPSGAWRGARRSGVLLLQDTDTPLLESVKAAAAPRRSSIIKVGPEQQLTHLGTDPQSAALSVNNKTT